MAGILIALAVAVLVPILSAVWSRRRGHAEAAHSLVFGLLIAGAAAASFYFALTLARPAASGVPDLLFILLKIFLFAAAVFGLMAGAAILWESYKESRKAQDGS